MLETEQGINEISDQFNFFVHMSDPKSIVAKTLRYFYPLTNFRIDHSAVMRYEEYRNKLALTHRIY